MKSIYKQVYVEIYRSQDDVITASNDSSIEYEVTDDWD